VGGRDTAVAEEADWRVCGVGRAVQPDRPDHRRRPTEGARPAGSGPHRRMNTDRVRSRQGVVSTGCTNGSCAITALKGRWFSPDDRADGSVSRCVLQSQTDMEVRRSCTHRSVSASATINFAAKEYAVGTDRVPDRFLPAREAAAESELARDTGGLESANLIRYVRRRF